MVSILLSVLGQRGVDALAFLLAFVLTALLTNLFRGRLPQDHGRAFAVDGALSKGKARGAGLIFVLCVVLVALAFMPFHLETLIYMVLLIASMLSGYLDDASDTAWNEYKKGLIDFVIAVVAGVTYLNFNGCGVRFLQWYFVLPYPVYLLLIVILIWASINVVNCTDGVDGLSASLAVVSMGTFALLYAGQLASYVTASGGVRGRAAGVSVGQREALHRPDGGRRQPGHGLFPGAAGPQIGPPLRLPAGGRGVHRGRQLGHREDQPQALFAHQRAEKYPDPPPRPRPQAAGLERRAGGPPLGHPAGRRLGGPGRHGRAGDVNLSRRASVFAEALACRVCATL